MLAIERRNAILAKISLTGKVLVSDLSRDFGVTEETIRRDLEKLDHDGLVFPFRVPGRKNGSRLSRRFSHLLLQRGKL